MPTRYFDENHQFILDTSYNETELFRLGGRKQDVPFYVPDAQSLYFLTEESTFTYFENDYENYDDSDFWFDSFLLIERDLLFYVQWITVDTQNQYFFEGEYPQFFVINSDRRASTIGLTTSWCIHKSLAKRAKIKRWRMWFNSLRSKHIVALYFFFTLTSIWFKTVGVGTFCLKLEDKFVQVGLGENHDIVFSAPGDIIFVQKPKQTRHFGCCGFLKAHVMAFAHQIRQYHLFNVYEYRGLLYAHENVRKKVTKRRLR